MIVLDTSILSLAFRRAPAPGKGKVESSGDEAAKVAELRRLIQEDIPIAVPGIVLQEILSGVRSIDQFNRLRENLAGFPVLLADREHHLLAADIANRCRWSGVAASTIDCIIASMALGERRSLFTTDQDFQMIAPLCGLILY